MTEIRESVKQKLIRLCEVCTVPVVCVGQKSLREKKFNRQRYNFLTSPPTGIRPIPSVRGQFTASDFPLAKEAIFVSSR